MKVSRIESVQRRGILGLVVCFLAVGPVRAQHAPHEREIAATKERIQALLHEAEDLQAAGHKEEAASRRREAAASKERLARASEGRPRARARDGERREILAGLEAGINALRALGRHEEAARLAGIAAEASGHREGSGEGGEHRRPAARGRRASTEREVALRQLEIMRTALPALREKGRNDSAALVERAIRAREVMLEGRRDDEAHRIREEAPTPGQQIELFAWAGRLWREFGDEKKAAALTELAESMSNRERRRRARAEEGERRERDQSRRGEGEHRQREVHREREVRREGGHHEREVRRERRRESPPQNREVTAEIRALWEEVQRLRNELERLRGRGEESRNG